MKEQAKAAAEEAAQSRSSSSNQNTVLEKRTWTPVTLQSRHQISSDTFTYTFSLPSHKKSLGLGTCQHIQLGIHMQDRMLIRPYTPTSPILESEQANGGTFELTIKTYFPDSNQPGGAFSNLLYYMPLGQRLDICGPTGGIEYLGHGRFNIEGKQRNFDKISLILGGSGVTPGYQLIVRILKSEGDVTRIRLLDANKTQQDIILRSQLHDLEIQHRDQFPVTHVLSHPSHDDDDDGWDGLKGHVNDEIIRQYCFAPEKGAVAFLCGPPAMVQKAALPGVEGLGVCGGGEFVGGFE